jgi:hypothetical protein
MARVQIARSAETDLLEGYVFYERQQPGVGDYFLDSLCADIDALALCAGIYPSLTAGCIARLQADSPSPSTTTRRTMSLPWWLFWTAGKTRTPLQSDSPPRNKYGASRL